MATIGKFCLTLTVLGLAVVSVWLVPTVGKLQNDVGTQLRDSKDKLADAKKEFDQRKAKHLESSHALGRLQIGWDKSWDVEQAGNAGITVEGARIAVSGLGTDSGLIPVVDGDGQEAAPAVHAFIALPEGMAYVGEFLAEPIEALNTTLTPTWQVTQEEVEDWQRAPEASWRFRTLIPSDKRLRIDRCNVHLQYLLEKAVDLDANVTRQRASLEDAEQQLQQRQRELLGDPGAPEIPGFPELSAGLTKAIRDLEDQRNDMLFVIDQLRRDLQHEAQKREQHLQRLQELSEQLPTEDEQTTEQPGQRAERPDRRLR